MTKQARSKLAQQAQLALLYEVTCLNKPGLVDPVDAGAHQDMDVFTFLESSVVLTPYFETFVQAGQSYVICRLRQHFAQFDKLV